MPKRKGLFQNQALFVSNMSIEACVRALESLQSEDVQITILSLGADTVRFRVRGYERDRLRVDGRGTLLRWEGTKTRVDCRLRVHEGILAFTFLMIILFVMVVGMMPAVALLFSGFDSRLLLLMSAAFLLMLVGLLWLINRFSAPDDAPMNIIALLKSNLC